MTALEIPKTLGDLLRGTVAGQVPAWNQAETKWEASGVTLTDILSHAARIDNPHGVTKAQVGLGNVANFAQEPAIALGAIGQYWRGDKSWQTLNAAAIPDFAAAVAAYAPAPDLSDYARKSAANVFAGFQTMPNALVRDDTGGLATNLTVQAATGQATSQILFSVKSSGGTSVFGVTGSGAVNFTSAISTAATEMIANTTKIGMASTYQLVFTSGAAGSLGSDTWINRQAAGTVGIGAASGAATGTLKAGAGIFTGLLSASNLSGSNTGDQTISLTVPGVLFSVTGSPGTGALGLSLLTQSANRVFKGPDSGAAAAPSFAALVKADLPLESPFKDQANTFTGLQTFKRFAPTVVSAGTVSSGTYTTDATAGADVRITLGANTVFAAPTSPVNGQEIEWWISQDATGGRSISLATGAGGFFVPSKLGTISASSSPGAADGLLAKYDSSIDRWIVLRFVRGDSLSDGQPIRVTFDGGGAVPTVGTKLSIPVERAGTIVSATVLDQSQLSGSAAIDVRKSSLANWPATTSIVALTPPALVASNKSQDNTLTGWTTDVAAGDVLEFVLSSASILTRLTVILDIRWK
jgi:hypothetical protein